MLLYHNFCLAQLRNGHAKLTAHMHFAHDTKCNWSSSHPDKLFEDHEVAVSADFVLIIQQIDFLVLVSGHFGQT